MVFVLGCRSIARRTALRVLGPERVLLVGEAPVTAALVRKIRAHPEYALEPVGVMTRDGAGSQSHVAAIPVLGTLDEREVAEVIKRRKVERVIVAQEDVTDPLMLELLQRCGQAQVKVSALPRHVEALGPSVEVDDIEGVTILGLNPLVLPRSARWLKRAMDVLGSAIGLLLAAPLLVLIAVAVKLDSPGPVLFRQPRIGRRGETFTLPKFRTMRVGAEAETEELLKLSEDPNWLKLDRDPRITRVGRVLRLTSLDELPQLWTVLAGRMSLVGPRPLVGQESDRVLYWAQARLDLAPGITGLWQVLGRTSIPFDEMVKLDYVYVSNWSLWTDIKLLLRTFPAVLARRGAN
jgi:exopolysaccharide biosynthesis polyprenyl glycosylphosphotransferase